MPVSRITFAIGDLVADIKRLLPNVEQPLVELHLGEAEFDAVTSQIEHHYGRQMVVDPEYAGHSVQFGACRIVKLEKPCRVPGADRVICSDCLRGAPPEGHLTQTNPAGGYGRPRVLVCDECMGSGRWDGWKAQHWPNWPEPNGVADIDG